MRRLLNGQTHNVKFTEFVDLIEAFGFSLLHVRGSHFIYRHLGVEDSLNLQPFKGEAKPYQIRQFLDLVELYDLQLKEDK